MQNQTTAEKPIVPAEEDEMKFSAKVGEINLRSVDYHSDIDWRQWTYRPTAFCFERAMGIGPIVRDEKLIFTDELVVYCMGHDEANQQIWMHRACAAKLGRKLLSFGG